MNLQDQFSRLTEAQLLEAHNIYCEHDKRQSDMYFYNDYSEILQSLTVEQALNSSYKRNDKYIFYHNSGVKSCNSLAIDTDEIISFIRTGDNIYLFPMLKECKDQTY